MNLLLNQKKLLIVDDHEMVRKGLWSLIQDVNIFKEFREASSGAQTLTLVDLFKPDFLFLDISLPDILGTELIEQMRKGGFKGHILVLTMHEEDEYIYRSYKAGASGYLHKSTTKDELEKAIYAIFGGIKFYLKNMTGDQIREFISKYDEAYKETLYLDKVILTGREKEVLKRLYRGNTIEEVGQQMNLSPRTVEVYRTNLLTKFRCKNVIELLYVVRSNENLLRKIDELKEPKRFEQ